MMRIRRLTEYGKSELSAALHRTFETERLDGFLVSPDDPSIAELHPIAATIDETSLFASRYEAASYLHQVLSGARIANVEQDLPLWGWLAVIWFDQLCPPDSNGRRKVGELARYLPSSDYKKRYRHLLAGPYRLYQSHADNPERALVVLSGPLDKPGELVEQLGSRVEVSATPSILAAATTLYIDRETKRPKVGAGGSGRGSARRFGRIIRQYDVTWDLAGMSPEEIVARLPEEFDRFR